MSMMETIKAGESETTEFKSSLAEWRGVVESISAFSNKNGRTIFIGVGDNCEYPIDALREAIINALIHRSYPEPADVRIFLFDTHAEIINPGTFPEGVTPKQSVHKPVNPILCSFMYDIGLIEKYGSGIKLMMRLCRKWGNREPFYDLHPLETKIVFESRIKETTYIEVADISDKLNDRQKKGYTSHRKMGL